MEKSNLNSNVQEKKIGETNSTAHSDHSNEFGFAIESSKRLTNTFQIADAYSFVFNILLSEFDYVSKGVRTILGYKPEELKLKLFVNNIHPHDKKHFLNFEQKSIHFFQNLPFDKIAKYKVQYDYRVRTKDKTYIRIVHQVIQLDYDEKNFYRTLGSITNISHIKKEGIPSMSIIGLEGEPSYHNVANDKILKKSTEKFTKRERQILKCIVESKSSKTIAKELFISIHTVKTHRKNIMLKADCNTSVDLVTKVISQGWI